MHLFRYSILFDIYEIPKPKEYRYSCQLTTTDEATNINITMCYSFWVIRTDQPVKNWRERWFNYFCVWLNLDAFTLIALKLGMHFYFQPKTV